MHSRFDSIVIGTGQAGPSLARRLADGGSRVAIIERGLFGGTCVNTGCIPTKALVASARAAHTVRRGSDYGVVVPEGMRVDMAAVKGRKDAISGRSRDGLESSLKQLENCTVFEGHARFESATAVRVNGDLLESDRIFINVGARARVPPMPGIDRIRYRTNSSMMSVDYLPRHLAIVGGSYVGLEFAQMYRRFGSEVTVVEKGPRLVAHEDADVSEAIQAFLEAEGVHVRLQSECIEFSPHGDGVAVGAACAGGVEEIVSSDVLLAVGRRPNTDDLGLDRAGVATDEHGFIVVDEELRTNVPGIWALGECNGRGAFTHTSYNDFEIVAANVLDGDRRRVGDRITAYALYTDPPLGRAGLTEAGVKRSGRRALMAKRPMERVGRAVEKGETTGFMKILVDAESEQILGAALLGVEADEVVHCILDLMYAKASYRVLQRAMHIHPTVAELLPTMMGELLEL
jgi:pyruvate/2-oxoglutarate dehydrogenase complex dihydrolipoamide dehydrogenase (E3) component